MKGRSIRRLTAVACLIIGLFLYGCGGGGGGGDPFTGAPFRYDPGVPGMVTGVQTSSGDQVVTVTWNPVSVASSYNIYYAAAAAGGGPPSSGWIEINVSGGTSCPVWGLTNRVTYYFVVTAANRDGEGPAAAQGQGWGANAVSATPGPITQADLAGTWYFHTIVCGPGAKWERGTVTIDSGGNVTFAEFLDSAHYDPVYDVATETTATAPSGLAWNVQGDGSIAMSGSGTWGYSGSGVWPSFQGTMGSRKNMWVGTWTYSTTDGSKALTIFQKMRATNDYTIWDISGTSSGQNPNDPDLSGNGPTRFAYHALNSGSSIQWEYSSARVGQQGQFWLYPSEVPASSYLYPLTVGGSTSNVKDVIYWCYGTPNYKVVEGYDLLWKVTAFGMQSDGLVKEYDNWAAVTDGAQNVVFTGRMTDDKSVVVGVSTKNDIDSSQSSTGAIVTIPGQYFMRIIELNFIPTDQSMPTYALSDVAGSYKFHEIGASLGSGSVAQASWAYGKMVVAGSGATTFPLWTDSNSSLSNANSFTLSYYTDTGSDGHTWTTFANFVSPDTGTASTQYYNASLQPYVSKWTWWNALTTMTQSGSGVRQIPESPYYFNEHGTLSYNKDLFVATRTDAFGYSMIVGLK